MIKNRKTVNVTLDAFLSEAVDANGMENKHLLNQILALSESDKAELSDKMITALYSAAVSKYANVDLALIERSGGDITRFEGYENIKKTIIILEDSATIFGNAEAIKLVSQIQKSVTVLESYKKEFILGFMQNKSFAKMTYNTSLLGILCGVSLILSVFADFTVEPSGDINKTMLNRSKKSVDYVLFDGLAKLNESAESGDLKKALVASLDSENFIGLATTIATTAFIAVAGVFTVVVALREIITWSYNAKIVISDHLEAQAQFVEINAGLLASDQGINQAQRKMIARKQLAMVGKLRKWSNKMAISVYSSDKKTRSELSRKISPREALNTTIGANNDPFGGFALV